MRNIPEGGELTVAYCDLNTTAHERQKALEKYVFTCTCSACEDHVNSDARRAMITEPHHAYPRRTGQGIVQVKDNDAMATITEPEEPFSNATIPSKELSTDEFIANTRRQIALCEEEGLEADNRYLGHLKLLSKVLDPRLHAQEINSLKAKYRLLIGALGGAKETKGSNSDSGSCALHPLLHSISQKLTL